MSTGDEYQRWLPGMSTRDEYQGWVPEDEYRITGFWKIGWVPQYRPENSITGFWEIGWVPQYPITAYQLWATAWLNPFFFCRPSGGIYIHKPVLVGSKLIDFDCHELFSPNEVFFHSKEYLNCAYPIRNAQVNPICVRAWKQTHDIVFCKAKINARRTRPSTFPRNQSMQRRFITK